MQAFKELYERAGIKFLFDTKLQTNIHSSKNVQNILNRLQIPLREQVSP
jgi:hypothetical protein